MTPTPMEALREAIAAFQLTKEEAITSAQAAYGDLGDAIRAGDYERAEIEARYVSDVLGHVNREMR